MASGILVVGPSGSGKTSGIRNLDPAQSFIINPDKKTLPIQGFKSKYKTVKGADGKLDVANTNYYEANDPQTILKLMKMVSDQKPETKILVIDTINHVMTAEFIKKIRVSGFQKWSDLAADVYNIVEAISGLRDDLFVFVTGHNETSFDADGGKVNKLRTLGKLLDEKINLESMFTTVLFTSVSQKDKNIPYGFMTQTDGSTTAKSPMGMFNDIRIPNDYQFVVDKIKEYQN